MKNSVRFALCLVLCTMSAVPMASAQEAMRPVGQFTYTPDPVEPQTDTVVLRPEDRMIRNMRLEARGGTVDIKSIRLIYRSGEADLGDKRLRICP